MLTDPRTRLALDITCVRIPYWNFDTACQIENGLETGQTKSTRR